MVMAAKAILMEHLKQILRLQPDGFSINAIVRLMGSVGPLIKGISHLFKMRLLMILIQQV
jgi:hypothetical protein